MSTIFGTAADDILSGAGDDDQVFGNGGNDLIDSAMNRKFGGTGLGLPLSRRLAELHGGSLELASARDKGTVATLRLPAHRIAI